MHDVFFFTDVHGCRPLFDAIMNYCHEQDPEAMIIFGGDAMDRGPDGYAIMKELLDNPYVVYLKGNHEDIFVQAAREIKHDLKLNLENMDRKEVRDTIYWCRGYDERYLYVQTSLHNGGIETLTDWVMDGMPMDIVDRIDHLPLTFSYGQCDFCHAAGGYTTFKDAADAEYDDKPVEEYAAMSLLWSRTALDVKWAPSRIAVFGHTPTPYVPEFTNIRVEKDWKVQPLKWDGKLDMDTGMVFTGRGYVLNVLTMKAHGFENNNGVKKIEVIQF